MAFLQRPRKALARCGPTFNRRNRSLCLISLTSSNVMSVLLLSVICMAMAFLPVFWAIPTEILSDSKAAVAVGMINALASLAGFAGPYAFGYLRAETGSFGAGFVMLMFCALAAGAFMLLTPAAQSGGPRSVTSS